MNSIFKISSALIFFSLLCVTSYAGDCTTIANNTWDCGTPLESDNLIVNHDVIITTTFNATGSITVNDGGKLTFSNDLFGAGIVVMVLEGGTLIIDGNVNFSSNSLLENHGTIVIDGDFLLDNSGSTASEGIIVVNGNVIITQGASFLVESSSSFDAQSNLEINSNGVIINGTVNVAGDFINNKSISGDGQIVTLAGCSGSGSINGSDASSYCSSGTIDMPNLLCGPDNTDPVISAMPLDLILYSSASSCSVIANWAPPSASDDCLLDNFLSTHSPGDMFSVGTTTVTYTASDAAGNTTDASFQIMVLDTIPPRIINIPTHITQYVDGISCGAIVSWTAPSASDNCSLQSFTLSHNPGDFFDIGTTAVTYTAVDGSSNTVTGSFEITILDNITPSISQMPGNITAYADASSCGTHVDWPFPVAVDNCSLDSMSSTHDPGDFFDVGTTQVIYTAVDMAQNTILASFNVTVEDTIKPGIIDIPETITAYANAGACGTNVDWTLPSASDNCSIQSLTSTNKPEDFFAIGITKITYTAVDYANNSFSASFDIVVKDTLAPGIVNMPEDITQYVGSGSCDVLVNWTLPTAVDNCSLVGLSSSHNSGDLFSIGTTTVTYTAIDASDNSFIDSFDIHVVDSMPPSISNMPEDIVHYTRAGDCNAIIDWSLPYAADNCSLLSFASTNNPGDLFEIGTTIVTYTAVDAAQNTVDASFEIIVIDTIPPALVNMPDSLIKYADADSRGTVVNWPLPSPSDDCPTSITSSHNPGEFFEVGSTTVIYTAVDASDNVFIDSFYITVLDTIAPKIQIPENITQYVNAVSCGANIDWPVPVATDNYALQRLTSPNNPGDFFPVGTSIVTYTAVDEAQNERIKSFTITLIDTIAPVIYDLPEEIRLMADAGACGKRINWPEPTLTDNCSATMSASHNQDDFFNLGITTVTYTATDIHGNTSSSSFDVMIGPNPEDEIQLAFKDTVIAKGESIQLFAGGNGVEYRWEPEDFLDHPGIQNPTATLTESIVYNVYMRTETGCFDKKQVTIHVQPRDSYFIPEMFTPDGDGINDILFVNTVGYGALDFKLFNRFGQMVFSTNDSDLGWDGRIKGQLQKPDTYVYTLVLQVSNDEFISEKGTIQLVR